MERKIGEIKQVNGEWCQCVEGNDCANCVFIDYCKSHTKEERDDTIGLCVSFDRNDGMHVIFKKLEKVGEPYIAKNSIIGERLFQKYKLYKKDFFINEKNLLFTNFENTVGIEIKQNKEDINKEQIETIHGRFVKKIQGTCLSCCFYSKGKCELTLEEARMRDCGMGIIYVEIKQNKEDMEEKTIKIKKEDIKVGSKVIYLPSNRPYVITEANCRMKYDGDWHDCVIYTPLYDNPYKCFVRPIKDFAQNFVLDSTEEKEEKHSNLENTGKNLKPFDLEAAKAGKSVCTRDGRKARIICFDAKDTQPIIGLYEKDIDGIVREYLCSYHMDGRMYDDHDCGYDLMMLPEKKEGWVNIYRDIDNNTPYTENDNIYSSRDKAKESAKMLNMKTYIDTIKVEWEE